MKLANLCMSMLDRAELRVSRLIAGEEDGQGINLMPTEVLDRSIDEQTSRKTGI